MFGKLLKNKQRGLTLMGVIFAIGIILVGLVGVLSLLRYVIVAGRISSNRFIASGLAQEGIEIVRSLRDDNWKAIAGGDPRPWNQGLGAGEFYQADYNDSALAVVNPSTPLKIDAVGYYGYDDGQETKYTRRIIIYQDNTAPFCPDDSTADNNDNFCVFSEVTWKVLVNNYSAMVSDRLYDWQ